MQILGIPGTVLQCESRRLLVDYGLTCHVVLATTLRDVHC